MDRARADAEDLEKDGAVPENGRVLVEHYIAV